jgi:ATP-dependent Zn protease
LIDSLADCARAATAAAGSSGADVARLARGVRRRARAAGREPDLADFLAELEDGMLPRSAGRIRRLAVHEAGHAVVSAVRRPGSVGHASVRGSRDAKPLGTVSVSLDPGELDTTDQIDGQLLELLAGRAAEEIMLGTPGTGAAEDLRLATALCVLVEVTFGLGGMLTGLGALEQGDVERVLLTRPDGAAAVEERLRRCYDATVEMLLARRAAVDLVAAALLEHDALDGDEIAALVQRAD